jgi:hypothetical protein
MNTLVRQRGTSGRGGQSASRIAAISAIFVAILSTTWLIGRQIFAPGAPAPVDRYKGLVQLAPDHEGRCAQFELDNRTGYLWPKGATPCGDITTAVRERSTDGPLGRLNGIADHFKGN